MQSHRVSFLLKSFEGLWKTIMIVVRMTQRVVWKRPF